VVCDVFGAPNHFGTAFALHVRVLKITTDTGAGIVTLRIEGAIAGLWVAELNRTWLSLAPLLKLKHLNLDLREVTRIDAAGRNLLAEILRETKTEVQTSSLLIESYVREAIQQNPNNRDGGRR